MKHFDDQDPIELLRALWSRVEPPTPDEVATDDRHQAALEWLDSALDASAQEPGNAAQKLDPSTTATIAWVRSAWSQAQVPAMPSPPVARVPRFVLVHRHLAAAAAALLIAGLAFTLAPLPSPKADPTLIAQAPESPTALVPIPASIPARIVPAGLELTSGPVRLTLLAQLTPTTKTQD